MIGCHTRNPMFDFGALIRGLNAVYVIWTDSQCSHSTPTVHTLYDYSLQHFALVTQTNHLCVGTANSTSFHHMKLAYEGACYSDWPMTCTQCHTQSDKS